MECEPVEIGICPVLIVIDFLEIVLEYAVNDPVGFGWKRDCFEDVGKLGRGLAVHGEVVVLEVAGCEKTGENVCTMFEEGVAKSDDIDVGFGVAGFDCLGSVDESPLVG